MENKKIAIEKDGKLEFINKEDWEKIIQESFQEEAIVFTNKKCDKYDYLLAVTAGIIGGLVDIFLVGDPNNSILGKQVDKSMDWVVIKFAKRLNWNPRPGNEKNVNKAIEFLQRNSKINYDQSISKSASDVLGILPNNHHMKSLAHSPDIIGLFFSIYNQFTSTSTFLSDGQLITMDTKTFYLKGNNFVSKIFCGFVNWFLHLASDVAGSGSKSNRGSGIVMPFYELFGLCNFGEFNTPKGKESLAEVATQAFEKGYDLRFGITMSIPLIITDLIIKFFWSFRRKVQYKEPLKNCIPIKRKHEDLRIMLLVGTSTLCVMDVIDAGVRSGGNMVAFVTRLNLVAWYKLVKMVLKEAFIQIGVHDFDSQVELLNDVDETIKEYYLLLKESNFSAYEKEFKKYSEWNNQLLLMKSQDDMKEFLLDSYKEFNIKIPWEGEFEEFMRDEKNRLVFD